MNNFKFEIGDKVRIKRPPSEEVCEIKKRDVAYLISGKNYIYVVHIPGRGLVTQGEQNLIRIENVGIDIKSMIKKVYNI